jgi:hypothetical protein
LSGRQTYRVWLPCLQTLLVLANSQQGEDMKIKSVRMLNGNAETPSRFWGRAVVAVEHIPEHLGAGWVITDSTKWDDEFDLKNVEIIPADEVIEELGRIVRAERDANRTLNNKWIWAQQELSQLMTKLTVKTA